MSPRPADTFDARPGFSPPNPDFVRAVRAEADGFLVLQFYGMELTRVAPGEATLELAYRDELSAYPGAFQGTVTGAVADLAGTLAALTLVEPGHKVMTIDYTVKFMALAAGGRLIGRGRVLRPGKTLSVCSTEVSVQDGARETVCATALLTTRNVRLKASR